MRIARAASVRASRFGEVLVSGFARIRSRRSIASSLWAGERRRVRAQRIEVQRREPRQRRAGDRIDAPERAQHQIVIARE